MRIAIISQYYEPDSSGVIPTEVARSLAQRGHTVKVLTTIPHYDGHKSSLLGSLRGEKVTLLDGVEVRRIPSFAFHTRNPITRIFNYLSFVLSGAIHANWLLDSDVTYVYGTPATAAEPARRLYQKNHIPYVYHVQDIWPDSVTESGFLPQRILSMLRMGIDKWLSKVYASAGAVVAIAPTARRLLVERGAPDENTRLIYNWSNRIELKEYDSQEGLTLIYAGNLGEFQDLETVVRAAKPMADTPGFRLLIAGGGVVEEKLKALVAELGIKDTVTFLGRVEREKMPQLYAKADFQIVSLKDMDFFAGTIPSKFQAGLAYGVPVITTVKGDVSSLVSEHGLGLVAQPENADSLATAYRIAFEMSAQERTACSKRAMKFFEDNFTKEAAMDQVEAILQEVVEAQTRRDGE